MRSLILALLLVAAGAGLAVIHFVLPLSAQERVLYSLATVALTAGLAWSWLLLLAPMAWRWRLLSAGSVSLLVVAFFVLFEFREFSGDLLPLPSFRWSPETPPDLVLPDASGVVRPPLAAPVVPDPSRDYPRFLGADGRATLADLALSADREASSPRELWRRSIGAGWSSFAIVGNAAFTQEQRGDFELVTRYDLRSGELVWSHSDAARYETPIAGVGPRATPTVAGGNVYSVGATALLNCLEAESGERIWHHDLAAELGARVPQWGKSASPLIVDDVVVVAAGGRQENALVAFDRETGELRWGGGTSSTGYSSPFLATLAGRRQIVILNAHDVTAHAPEDGSVLWQHPWDASQPTVAQPLQIGDDRLFVSSGYGVGCELIRIERSEDGSLTTVREWHSLAMKAKFSNVVEHDGHVYGLDDGILACVELESGKRRWKGGRYGHGQIILARDRLLVTTESGDVVLVAAAPDAHRELARFEAVPGKTWNPPAMSGNLLLVRNAREAACFELPLAEP